MTDLGPDLPDRRWSLGNLVAVRECPACGGSERAPEPYRIRDYLGSAAEDEWCLWRCASCGSLFLDPRPDDASIPLTYKNYYTHHASAENAGQGLIEGVVWRLFNAYFKSEFNWDRRPRWRLGRWLCAGFPPLSLKLDYFCRHLWARRFPNKGVLLDIGCGNGEFLRQARDMGWQAHGVEPDHEAAEACRAQGLSVFEGVADAVPDELLGTVDVVTLSHCIEHVTDADQLLARSAEILKPGGWIWLATPNPDGIGLKVFGNAWRGLEPSRHLCVPSQSQLIALLARNGFDDIRVLRRGAHGKTITRESAAIAKMDASARNKGLPLRAWLALPVRLLASIGGSLSPRWGEETVVVGKRKPD